MTPDDPRLTLLRENTSFAVRELGKARGEPMDLSRESVEWIEGFIERQRKKFADAEARAGLVSVIGSYLGEAIIAASDGRWDTDADGALGVCFENGYWCYPFNKVDKQFADGLAGGESILSFYNVSVNMVATGKLDADEAGGPLQ
jgi:hypothetical protein